MSLRSQIASLLLVLSLAFVTMTYAVQALVVMPAFVELERQDASRDVNRCVDALERDVDNLSNLASDWGSWDETYQYAQDHNPTFVECNLIDEAFGNSHVNLICILDKDQKIVWGEARDIESLELIEVPSLFETLQDNQCPLAVKQNIDGGSKGVLLTERGPLLLASRAVITSKREGPPMGTVIMGRFLSEAEIESLADRTHVKLDVWACSAKNIPATAQANLDACVRTGEQQIEVYDSKLLQAYTVMNDVYGKPAMLVRVHIPREVTIQGSMAAYVATGCSIAGGILTLLVMWIVLQWRIVGPLRAMAVHAVQVGSRDDLKARLQFDRSDEIGTLSIEFDRMVESLAQSRKKVLDTAHRAGMAEIASEVLHNVGNAVNSANCSVEVLDERLNRSKVVGLERAATMLRDQAPHAVEFFGQDPRGLKLIDYLISINDALQNERTDNKAEVLRLRETVRHIRDAISAQQTFAGRSDFRQDVELQPLLNEILKMNQELIRTSEVQVVVDLPALPELQLNKSKMTQVLVNLVRNAIQSMQDQPSDCRRLIISARCAEDDGIVIEICDTGMGFTPEVQAKLFTHGFTTKTDGNGFGLHYCANAIREAGGHVSAQSAGVGQGATFRIQLPHVMPTTTTIIS